MRHWIPWFIVMLGLWLMWTSSPSWAYSPTVSWTHPTRDTAGRLLPAGFLTGTRIEYGTCNGLAFGVPIHGFIIVGLKNRVTAPNVQPGTYCYRLFSQSINGESAPSLVVQTIVPASSCGGGCH